MLGRGLESLIPPAHQNNNPEDANEEVSLTIGTTKEARPIPKMEGPIFHIETSQIEPNPHQPRKVFDEAALRELASSIAEFGLLQPLVVTKVQKLTDSGAEVKYQLIAGERRLLASKMLGLERVPAIVRSPGEEREKLELAIIENLQRANLNSIETARAYAKLQDHFGLTQREIAVRLGKSREVIGNGIRLLSLPTYIQDALGRSQISESQARLLLAIGDSIQQQKLFDDIIRNNLSVRDLKNRISRLKSGEPIEVVSRVADPEVRALEDRLQQFLGTKVKLQKQGAGGKITIDFYSQEELQGILDKLLADKLREAGYGADIGGAPPTEEFHV